MTFDPKPLLKGFGAVADVATQIATDKAVNSRRTRSDFSQFDITQGQLIENATLDATNSVAHALKRVPKGAIILSASTDLYVIGLSSSAVTFSGAGTVTAWVV